MRTRRWEAFGGWSTLSLMGITTFAGQ
jgi:hypothetical protein